MGQIRWSLPCVIPHISIYTGAILQEEMVSVSVIHDQTSVQTHPYTFTNAHPLGKPVECQRTEKGNHLSSVGKVPPRMSMTALAFIQRLHYGISRPQRTTPSSLLTYLIFIQVDMPQRKTCLQFINERIKTQHRFVAKNQFLVNVHRSYFSYDQGFIFHKHWGVLILNPVKAGTNSVQFYDKILCKDCNTKSFCCEA